MAIAPGLRDFPAHHGEEYGTPSLGSDFRRNGRRRNRWYSWHLPFHSGHGQLAHCFPPLALIRGETKVWPAQPVLFRKRNRAPEVKIEVYSSSAILRRHSSAFGFTFRRDSAAAGVKNPLTSG